MFTRLFIAFIGLCFSFQSLSQTLTISSASNSGSYSYSAGVLTISSTSNIQAATIVGYLNSGSLSIVGSTSSLVVNVNQALTSTTAGGNLSIGSSTNTGTITISSDISLAGALTLNCGTATINANLTTSTTSGDVIVKSSGDIILGANDVITTSGASVVLWANSDNGNSAGSVALRNSSSIVTGSNSVTGGNVWIGGGSNGGSWNGLSVGIGYAVPGTNFSPSNGGSDLQAGVYLERCSISSFGGDVKILGNVASTGRAITTYGTISIDAKAGEIEIEGNATNSAVTNAYGVLFGIHDVSIASVVNLTSSASGTAITIRGFSRGTQDAIGLSGTMNVQSTGSGGILFSATSYGSGDGLVVGNFYHGKLNVYAASGDITFSGGKGISVAAAQSSGITTGPSKLNIGQGGSISSSSSNVILTGDVISSAAGGIAILSTGNVTIQPSGSSFTSAFTYASPAFSVPSTVAGLTIGKVGNAADITIDAAQTVAGPISIYGRDIDVNQNLTSSLSGAAILLQATAAINVAAGKVIQTNAGDVTLNACSGGVATSASSAIYLYAGSQILTSGGDITLGGAFAGTEGNLYAATNISGGGYAVRLLSATLSAAGGDIRIYGRNINSYGDGVFLSAVTINTTGAGTIGIYGDSFGGHTPATTNTPLIYFGGITFNANASLIQTVNGNLTLKGVLTQSQSTSGYGINFYRQPGQAGQTNHIQLLSQNGDINITGDAGTTIGGGIGHSSWGNVYLGSPANASFTATGDIKLMYSKLVGAGLNGMLVKTTGHVTYEPTSISFTATEIFPHNSNYVLADGAASLTIGKPGNTGDITISSAQSVAGDLTIYGGTITLSGNLTTTNNGDISLFSNNALAGLSSPRTINAAGVVAYAPQGSSFATAVTYPITNLTVTCNGLTIGKVGNSSNVTVGSATSIAGQVNIYGGALALNANLNTTNTSTGNILLQGTSLAGTGNIGLAAGRTVTMNLSTNSTYGGVISGTGSGLTKLGAGMLTLTNDHTYTGVTTISAGDLQVGTGGSLTAASSGTIAVTSGVVVAAGSELILAPNENIVFAAPISGAGGVEIKGNSGSYYNAFLTSTPTTFVSSSTVLEVLTRITAGLQRGGAIATSTGEFAGAYHKNYNASTNTATLQFQQFDGQFTKCVFVRLTQSGTNVQISANTSVYSGAAYRNGNQLGVDMSTGSVDMALATSTSSPGYGISRVYMSGKVNFSGALTYTGNTVLSTTVTNGTTPTIHYYVSKGTQEITDNSSSFPAASTVVNNGLIIFNRATAMTIASNLSGTEEVLQVGAPITLSGTCTHTGLTSIDLNKSLIVGNGSTAGSITGNIINYGTLTFNRSDNSSYPGVISGTGTLVKNGAGELTLTGLQTFTGATTINAGKLVISRDVPAFSSSSVGGAGELVIQPTSTSFTNAVSYPITGITVGGIGGLTLGKSGNLANITFASNTTIAGPITAYGGVISANANLSSTLSGADILLQGSKVAHNSGVTVQTNGGDITYAVTNSPWTTASDQCIIVGTSGNSALSTINAQGGQISLSGSFATTGVTNTSVTPNPDVAVLLYDANLQTTGSGSITINGNAFDNESVNSNFIWGVMFNKNVLLQTQNGNISVTGRPGKLNVNGRGIIADGSISTPSVLRALSASGTIQFTESMPVGHSNSNYTGAYFKPSATAGSVQFGADGSTVVSSSSNIIFDTDRITFDGTNPTLFNTTGTLTIRPVSDAFKAAVSYTNITAANLTGLTIGKSTNTENITIGAATSVNGPITLHGGALTLNGALTTTSSTSSPSNISLNGTTVSNVALNLAQGSTLTMNLSSNANYSGLITGTNLSFVKNGTSTLALTGATALNFVDFTISGGTFRLNSNQQLTLTGALTNNGTFTMRSGATFVPSTSVSNVTGNGTFNVQRLLTGNETTWNSTTSGRFWYMGVPMVNTPRSSFGTQGSTTNRVWSYNEVSKSYTELTDPNANLTGGTGYVHRRSTNDTLTFTGVGANGLRGSAFSQTGLTRTSGSSVGFHLVSNPYMAYVDWDAVVANTNTATSNIESTYYIRSAATGNISALISYNATGQNFVNGGVANYSVNDVRYLAPMQAFWVRVGSAASTGSLGMNTGMLSHQTSNPGLKNTTVFPTLARVNLLDGPRFDQLLVFMSPDMTNAIDAYDSEKMFVSGAPQLYTMAAGKKLVMNGLKNNKKKISVPLYLELPESKVYNLQLAEYILEDGLILLEDKQEGTIQDFTIHDTYAFYANSGVLQNRFVLHFYMPDAGVSAQGPSNSWVEEESAINEGGSILVSTNGRGKVTIQQDIDASSAEKGSVVVRDAAGKEVYNSLLSGSETVFELNTPSGVYFVEVQLNGQIEVKKIFVQQ